MTPKKPLAWRRRLEKARAAKLRQELEEARRVALAWSAWPRAANAGIPDALVQAARDVDMLAAVVKSLPDRSSNA